MSITRTLGRVVVGVAVCAGTTVALGTGPAAAGEITGNGQLKEVKAQSICAFSGQNDGYHIPELREDEHDTGRVQSYGQIRRTGAEVPPEFHPGASCNGHTGFLAGGH